MTGNVYIKLAVLPADTRRPSGMRPGFLVEPNRVLFP